MKTTYWRILVGTVIVLALISFTLIFKPGIIEPSFLSLPFVFWSGILLTTLLVVLTFIGSRIFPYKNEDPS